MKANITNIKNIENLNIVTFDSYGLQLKMVSLELSPKLQVGSEVVLGVKATAISIAKTLMEVDTLSFDNKIEMNIKTIELGEILSILQLSKGERMLESLITTDSAQKMQLKEGESVIALINASDLSIVEII